MTDTPTKITSADVYRMLEQRYPSPEWALMGEVAPETGGGTRYADAIAVNLWKSRGHAIHGFEVKVSRSDWLRELKQPEKAEPIYRYCDHWWIVAPAGIVKDGELPPTWGLLEARESGLRQAVVAPRLEAVEPTRGFFASLMRRGHGQIEAIARRKREQEVQKAYDDIQQRVDAEVARRTRRHDALVENVRAFEEETGLKITNASAWATTRTIKMAQRLDRLDCGYGDESGGFYELTRLASELERHAKSLREAVEESGMVTPPKTEAETS